MKMREFHSRKFFAENLYIVGWTFWCLLKFHFIESFYLIELFIIRQYQVSLVAQRVKHLPAMQETWVRSLGQEGPLEKEMATHSNTFAWKIPWTEEPGRLQSMGLQRIGHDWASSLNNWMIWIQPRCLAIDKCIKNMWYMYIKEYYLVIKENEILPFRTTWMDL